MTHHVTHGKNCICHSCQPNRTKVWDRYPNSYAQTPLTDPRNTTPQPRGAQR